MLRIIDTGSLARISAVCGLTAAAVVGLVACGGPPAKMVAASKDDGVPANSASEERLASGGKPKPPPAPAPSEDSARPYTTPMNGGDGAAEAPPAAAPTTKGGKGVKAPLAKEKPEPKGAAAAAATGGAGKVSKVECKQLFDKYIDLTVGSDSRFEGIPPEMIAQLKSQALSQAQAEKGDPCSTQDVSRTQYNCAISSTSTTAWQRCMK